MSSSALVESLKNASKTRNLRRDAIIGFGGATLYTVVVSALVYFHLLDIPEFLADLHP